MCHPCDRHPSDKEIIDFLADHDFEGDISPEIARDIAADYLAVYPRGGGEGRKMLVAPFKGDDGKIIPLTVHLRKKLADFIFPPNDSS